MIRILLVDDHELFRAGLRSILQAEADLVVVGEAASGEAAVEQVRAEPPDLVMMDVNMPGIGGVEATRRVLRAAPQVRVVAVTVLSDDPFPGHLLDAGAMGYISKGSSAREMIEAVREVMAGRHYLSADVARKLTLAGFRRGDHPSVFDRLTPREMQVMMMVVAGDGNQQISDALFLSPKTISTYRHRLFEKLGVRNDVELTHLAVRHGLIEVAQ